MKRKILFSIAAVTLFGLAIAFSLDQEHEKESELVMKNIEALAGDGGDGDEDEGGGSSGPCPSGCNGESCEGRYDTMVESGEYYCCAVYNFWRGKQCSD